MANFELHTKFPRREALRLAAMTSLAFCLESYASAADFWNKKKPSEWTDQEKLELQTKSPWAKKVDADMAGGGGGGGGRGSGGGGGGGGEEGGGGGGGSRGGGGGGGGGGGRGGGGSLAPSGSPGNGSVPLVVVWETAKPIQAAHPITLPGKLDGHYVLAVTGIPQNTLNAVMMGRGGGRGGSGGGRRGGGGRDTGGFGGGMAAAGPPPETANVDTVNGGQPAPPADPTAGLKRGAMLTVKGKAPQNADVVMSMNNNQTLLFGFTKDALALAVADKEVEFDLKLANMSAKTKFNLKDMIYQEELAL